MTYKETLEYLYSRLPMFQRIGAAAYKADLSNTIRICEVLGNPEKDLKTIHIAGTNGKGSVSHMLSSILQEAGYKTGLYTSPHLIDFRERIKINGVMIPEEYVCSFVERYKQAFDEIQPSFFEWTVGLCFDYFRSEKVDIAVIETGLGGRLDSTNVIEPLLSVITNISFDHQALLGETLEKIANEKAGIIKKNIPVVIGESSSQTDHVFLANANEKNSKICFADKEVTAENLGPASDGRIWKIKKDNKTTDLKLELRGKYQGRNLKTVLCAVTVIKDHVTIPEKAMINGLSRVISNTGLYGRWQTIQETPKIICDTGHNESGINEILDGLKEEKYKKLHWVLGVVNDKDVYKILSMLPKDATYYFTKASVPRALDEVTLKEQAAVAGLKGDTYPNVGTAIRSALEKCDQEDLIMIGGSTFIVGDALANLNSNAFSKISQSGM